MNEVLRWHDNHVLQFIQEWYYGWSPLSGLLVCLLLVLLPVHRRLAQFAIVFLTCWVLMTVLIYGALTEAPVLACATVFAAIYSGLRGLTWRMRRSDTSHLPARVLSWLRPNGRWTSGIIRDYLRVDPRGTYWLDVARASRGRIPDRSTDDRRNALFPAFEIPPWRTRLWRHVVFPLAEVYIRWTPRLPRYWHYDHRDLDLGEADVQWVLSDEIALQSRLMSEAEDGRSFKEYLHRTVDAKRHAEALQQAGRYGRKACLLQEAWIESQLFLGQFDAGDKRLCHVADSLIDLWRFRRRHDHLWASEFLREEPATSDVSVPAQEATTNSTEGAPEFGAHGAGKTPDVRTPDSDEEPGFGEIELSLASDNEPSFETKDSMEHSSHTNDAFDPSAATTGEDAEDRAVALLPQRTQVAVPRTSSPTINAVSAVLSLRDSERVRDLRIACEILEAYLEFEPSEDLDATTLSARRLLDRPARWPAVTRLMMLYGLRADWSSDRQERAKAETIAWVFQWVRSLLGQDELVKTVKQLFFDLLIDWHACRGGYSQIRELFSQNEPRGARQWELLGIAEAHIARQVQDRPSLRDSLIRDATAALFRARVAGFWTQRYAGLLLGTSQPAETIRLLQDHNVGFGRRELDRLVAGLTVPKPNDKAADGNGDVVLEMEAPISVAPQWFQARHHPPDTPKAPPAPKKTEAPFPHAPVPLKRTVTEPPKPVAPGKTDSALPNLVLVDVKSGSRIQCKKYPVRFGSEAQNQIKNSKWEPQHCAITWEEGHLQLVSMAKRANIKVNDYDVPLPVLLKTGDVLQIGHIRLQVESL
ncbi:MAG: FHA domain-containing protein [Planctomycetota bacterium]